MKIVYKKSVIIGRIRIHHVANQWTDLENDGMTEPLSAVQIPDKEEILEIEIGHVHQETGPDHLDVMSGIERGNKFSSQMLQVQV